MIVSIFNDVVGPVMRGPSSSHCAAALRIGRIARDLMRGEIDRVHVEFDLGGSLPTTHTSQGSDMGLLGGLLGFSADDDRLPEAERWLRQAGIDLDFAYLDLGDPHPNTYRLTLESSGLRRQLVVISTGGGMMEVTGIDGVEVSIGGDYDETLVWLNEPCRIDLESLRHRLGADHAAFGGQDAPTPLIRIQSQCTYTDGQLSEVMPAAKIRHVDRIAAVLPVRSRRGVSVPFQSCAEMIAYDGDRDSPLWKLAVEYESQRGGVTESEVIETMCEIVRIVRRSVQQGLRGTDYDDRILGFQSGQFQQAMEQGRLIDGGVLNQIVLLTTAMMEVKSSMGVIVAAPTAGACAAFPAVCLGMGRAMELDDQEIAKGMLAGGLIGVFIATHWSFAAEVGGCQAEGGSAAAMSAAAMVTYRHGSARQATGAASMALQNMLGLICDPVANRVEVPCLGKNVMAASNALSCANMQLAGLDAVIPLDETIAAARSVSQRMPREHRCTGLGGLAVTPTSKALQKRLESCGSCSINTASIPESQPATFPLGASSVNGQRGNPECGEDDAS